MAPDARAGGADGHAPLASHAPGSSPASRPTRSSARPSRRRALAQARRRPARPDRARASAPSSAPASSSSSARRSATPGRRSSSRSSSPASRACSPRSPTPSWPRRSRSPGSAYTYSYATLGELVAWIIGWDLILEYGVSVAAVAVGWGGVLQRRCSTRCSASRCPTRSPARRATAARSTCRPSSSCWRSGAAERRRARERAHEHDHGLHQARHPGVLRRRRRHGSFNADNFSPFAPQRLRRRSSTRRALIFFAYIGFDAISTSGEETKNPQTRPADRDHRLAADRTLHLHPGRGRRPSGWRRPTKLAGSEAPLATRSRAARGFGSWAARHHLRRRAGRDHRRRADGPLRPDADHVRDDAATACMPRWLRQAQPRARRRCASRRLFGVLIAILAAFVPLTEIAKLVNIGTLFAFVIVNIGVIVLRRTQPDLKRSSGSRSCRCSRSSARALCIYLMTKLRGRDLAAVRRLAGARPGHLLRLRAHALAAAQDVTGAGAARGQALGRLRRLSTGARATAVAAARRCSVVTATSAPSATRTPPIS